MESGAMIKRIRTEKGITQREVAEATGITIITIQNYEAGRTTPKLESLKKIAAALGVSTEELLGGNSMTDDIKELEGRPAPKNQLEEKIGLLSKGEQRIIESFVDMLISRKDTGDAAGIRIEASTKQIESIDGLEGVE